MTQADVFEVKEPERKMLLDYFDDYDFPDDDEDGDKIIVDGKEYTYQMTLSMEYADDECCRVLIDGEYYYFG